MEQNELEAFEESMKTYQRKDLSGLLNLFSDDTPLEGADSLIQDDELLSSSGGDSDTHEYMDHVRPKDLHGSSALKDERIGLTSAVPHPHDPNLFAVRVKRGFAEELVRQVAVKCLVSKDPTHPSYVPEDIGILTAFTSGKDAEYIYIEALTKKHLTQGLAGLQNIYFSRIEAVPVDQRRKLLLSCLQTDSVKVGDFARIKIHPYRGDLCQILQLVENSRVVVKVIPRMDFTQSDLPNPRDLKRSREKFPQKFFTPLAVQNKCLRREGADNQFSTWEWCGYQFDDDGYWIRKMTRFQLSCGSNMAKMTEAEWTAFHKGQGGTAMASALMAQRVAYNCGETVKVVRGDFRGAIGDVVETVHDRQLVLRLPNMCLTVDRSDVSPYFHVNTDVVVINGPHTGLVGTVSFVHEGTNVACVLTNSNTEVEIPMMDLQLSNRHIASVASRPRGIACREHDLVKLVPIPGSTTTETIVFVTRVTAGSMMGMLLDGSILRFTLADVSHKVASAKKVSVHDKLGNTICVGDSVQVDTRRPTTAVSQGILAVVKQVHLRTLFLYSEQYVANAGCFIESTDRVIRVGSMTKRKK